MTPAKTKFRKIFKILALGLSGAVILFSAFFLGYRMHLRLISQDKYKINMIVQIPVTEKLKTAYLAEIIGLSQDKPVSYFDFNERKALLKLLKSPLIKTAEIKKIKPSFVYINYTVKEPVALLCDYPNIALDKDGFIFPLFPFFPPKNLPEIYLDLPELAEKKEVFSQPLKYKNLNLALEILKVLQSVNLHVKRIDTAQAFSKSYGKREIIVVLEEELMVKNKRQTAFVFPRILRLSCEDWTKQLGNYFELRKKMNRDYLKQLQNKKNGFKINSSVVCFKPKVIDLRISKLAFID